MGILKKLLCKHPNVMYFEGRIDIFADGTRIRRQIYCPDCGLSFLANKAEQFEPIIDDNKKGRKQRKKIK